MKVIRTLSELRAAAAVIAVVLSGLFTTSAANTNIVVWGTGGVASVPDFPTNPIAVTGGDTHGIALLADRTVRTWGGFAFGGGISPPPNATNIIGIASGSSHALAVREDGTLIAWGRAFFDSSPVYVSPEATNVVALGVGTGAQHILVLRADGTVVNWGYSGVTNIPSEVFNIVSVAAGAQHSLALRSDGRVLAWGGQTNVPVGATNIVAIATTWLGNIALRADGSLLTWGVNPTIPGTLNDVVEVAGSGGFAGGGIALKRDGTVASGGSTANGTNIMTIGGSGSVRMAVKAAGPPIFPLPPVRRTVAVGETAYMRHRAVGALPLSYQWSFQGTNLPGATNAVLVITNAQASATGFYSLVASNALGMVTNSEMQLVVLPSIIVIQPSSQKVYVGAATVLTVNAMSQLPLSYQWYFNGTNIAGATNNSLDLTNLQFTNAGTYSVNVSNAFGSLTSSNAIVSVHPIVVTQPPQDQVIFSGGTISFSIVAEASSPVSYQWKFNGTNLPTDWNSTLTLTNVQYGQSGDYCVLASTTNGSVTNSARLSVVPVAAWGYDAYGQTRVPAYLTNVIALASGSYHSIALVMGGIPVVWGDNSYGQANPPAGLTNVVAFGAGFNHIIALNSESEVIGWGASEFGQSAIPEGLANVVSCAAGSRHTLVLKDDGSLIAWGNNEYGSTNIPADAVDFIAIAAGRAHNLALKDSGEVVAWGLNDDGQTNVPPDLTNIVAIAAGNSHSVALRADGTVVAWGKNNNGQTNVPYALSNVVAIAAGNAHTVALKADGGIVAWGNNNYGQVSVPPGLTNVVAIAAGWSHNLALVGSDPLVQNGLPFSPVWATNVFSVSLVSQNNRVYRLEHKDSLSESNWTPHPLVAGTGGTITFADNTATRLKRFYRIRRW